MMRNCLLFLAGSILALAQTTGTATLVGTLTDSTGAVVAGAKVTVVNIGTSFTSTTVTNNEGYYFVPYLNPGTYQLSIEAAGFKRYVRDGVALRTNESPRIDVMLEVGAVSDSIQVTGAPPLLETETSVSGGVLGVDTIVKIPVLQKLVFRLTLYLPGTQVVNGVHAMGQRDRAMGYVLDGLSAKEPVRGPNNSTNQVITSTTDAMTEVKLFTTGMPAEFGHSSGGQLSAVFRSGTNQFHGSGEDRFVNKQLMHRNYFDVGRPTGPFTYHEITGVASGPVWLPKLYNGKDKTFFLFGYTRHHENGGESVLRDVPSPDMLAGNFSFGGVGQAIYDPLTTRQEGTTWLRTPLPGNIVPQSRFDTVAKNFLAQNPFTAQNQTGTIDRLGPHQNYANTTAYKSFRTRFDIKLDHQFSSAHKMFGRYSQSHHRAFSDRWALEINWRLIDPNTVPIPIDQENVVVSDIWTFSPTIVNELRLGMNRRKFTRVPEANGQGWAKKLGIPNVGDDTFPGFSITTYNYRMQPGGYQQDVGEDFTFQDNFTKVRGKHTLKFGYELIRTRYNSLAQALPSGTYTMGGTDAPFVANTGNNFAAFLLGSVSSATFTRAVASWLPRWWSHAFYAQTDWKPLRNVTVNLGLRWSYESPFSTKYGQQSQFDPTARDPITGRLGAIVHGKGLLARKDLNNFQPRVGLAWTLTPKLVFRGNFGMITSDLFTNGLNQNFEEYQATGVVAQTPGDPRIAFLLSQGPPTVNFPAASDGSVPFVGSNYSGRNASWFDPNMRSPYVMNWSGGLQYQLTSDVLTEVQYQGSAGVKLLNNWDYNAIPLDISRDPAVLQQVFQAAQNYKPYPQFGAIQHYSNYGHNTYHGATIRGEKRFSRGFFLNGFYTFSKTINNTDGDGGASGITFYNRSLEKGRANYDTTHRFVSVFTSQLPFGKGRKYLQQGFASRIFGGWDFMYSQTLQTGVPVTIGFNGSPFNYLPGARRANQVLPNDQAKFDGWAIGPNRFPTAAQNPLLNIDAFRYPAAFTAGTVGRNTITGTWINWVQTSLSKEFPIKERAKFILRVDVNNPFKTQAFADPDAVFNTQPPVGSRTFGRHSTTRGSFSDVGGRLNTLLVLRVEW
ncbi:MAG: TonB-dependent receptor [Acidobacteria bacterium]|nr:TonB-dependent receptor [Acidobacteriota bacterium]